MENVINLDPMQRARDLATAAREEQEELLEDQFNSNQRYVKSMWDKADEVMDYQLEALRWQKKFTEVMLTELWAIETRLAKIEDTPQSDGSQTDPSEENKDTSGEGGGR